LLHAGVWGKAHPRAALRRRGGQLRATAGAPAALALGEHHSLGSIIYNVKFSPASSFLDDHLY